MKKLSKKEIVLLIVLVLATIGLTGCANGSNTLNDKIRVSPSAEYLREFAREDAAGICGPATDAVKNDWIAQNEPDYQ